MTTSELCIIFLTTVIALSGIIGARIFNRQLDAMQGQLSQMKATSKIAEETLFATQRPWVSIDVRVGERGLYYDVNGANLALTYLLKNTGNTPAVSVRIEGSPRIDLMTNDRISELERVCFDAKGQPQHPKMVAYTIFPGASLDISYIYTFANKENLDYLTECRRGFINIVVIGCIDYFFTFGSPAHHQSRFVYDLDELTLDGSGRAINISDGDKLGHDLRLTRWLEGGSFQAD